MDRITLSHVRLKHEKEKWAFVGPFDNELYPDSPKQFAPYMERTYLGVGNDGFPVYFSFTGKQPTDRCRVALEYGSGFLNWVINSGEVFIGGKKYSLIRLEELPPECACPIEVSPSYPVPPDPEQIP